MNRTIEVPTARSAEAGTRRARAVMAVTAACGLGLAGGLALPSTANATGNSGGTATCATAWPTDVQGRPTSIKAGSAEGAWVWHDGNGWHIRVTHDTKNRTVFRGFVTTTGKVHGVGVRVEGRDVISRTADMKTLGFRFTNYGGIDGIDFRVAGCDAAVRIGLSADGEKLAPAQIRLGADASAATTNPFGVKRA